MVGWSERLTDVLNQNGCQVRIVKAERLRALQEEIAQLHAEGAALAGQRIGLLSYGSGSCAEFYSGVVGEKAAERMARADLDAVLAKRERVSVEEYERLMNLPYDAPEAIAPEPGTFRLAEIHEFRRKYAGA